MFITVPPHSMSHACSHSMFTPAPSLNVHSLTQCSHQPPPPTQFTSPSLKCTSHHIYRCPLHSMFTPSLDILLAQSLVVLMVFLHLVCDVIDGGLELGRHLFPPVLIFTLPLSAFLLHTHKHQVCIYVSECACMYVYVCMYV